MNIRIEQDEGYDSPRDWDNIGEMVCFHGRYNLGDKDHDYRDSDYSGWEEMSDAMEKDGAVVILPLHLYDHSGITMQVGSFSCGWDSGQVGFIIAKREKILKEFSRARITNKLKERIEKILCQEVETYDQYLTGDVWGYIIEDDDGEHLDSCWGFYGREFCEKEAQDALEYLEQKEKDDAAELNRVQAAVPCCHV